MAKLAVGTKAGFAVGQIAGQLFRDVPSLLLLFYLTTVMGIAPAVAGAAIFVPKVFFGALFAALSSKPNTRISDGALVLDLSGSIVEQPAEADPANPVTANA